MKQIIELEFDKELVKLAGNTFGKMTYDEQVKNIINLSNDIVVVIPERMNGVASSFVQGFFDDIVRQIGIDGVTEKFEFISTIPDLKDMVLKYLKF